MAGNQIAALRKRAGLSQTELADRIGTTLNMLGKLERGERGLTSAWLDKLSAALNVSRAAILGEAPVEIMAHEAVGVPAVGFVRQAESNAVQLRRFDISYAMGPGTNIDDYVEEEPFEVDAGWLSTITRSPADRLGVARGSGDSMFPTILDSDYIIFDTTQRTLNLQDRIWVCSINGAGAIKRLRPLNRGRVEVISDNPTHGSYEVDAEDVFLLGRVLASIRKH